MRQRVAALIEKEGQLLYVRQHARGSSGRYDGPLYLTPPGGGVEQGESLVDAVVREVREEVGMIVSAAAFVAEIDHTGGSTAVFDVSVEPGDPALGVDPEIACDCPRLVGMEWAPAPAQHLWRQPDAISLLRFSAGTPWPTRCAS